MQNNECLKFLIHDMTYNVFLSDDCFQVMKTVIDETTTALQAARLELGELKLKNAQEREKLLGEMQQLSTALIQSREQMKEAKETEINLRLLLQNYDEKFNGLQSALKDTNGAYEEFKAEMSRVIFKFSNIPPHPTMCAFSSVKIILLF